MSDNSLTTQMSSNVNIGMDEVVSVFVAKYEDNLFEKKTDLQRKLKDAKKELTDLDDRLRRSVNKSQYEIQHVPVLNLSSHVEKVDVRWEGGYGERDNFKPVIRIVVAITDHDDRDRIHRMTKNIDFPISNSDVNMRGDLTKKVEDLNGELTETLSLIKTVSRKERQVRGRIAEMKLKESGYEELLSSPEMLTLIQLDD